MVLPDPLGVGYFPKRTQTRPEWLKASAVQEICSVSQCISPGPEDWIQEWLHNDLGFYDSIELAWQVAGPNHAGFEMFAYQAHPLQFDEGSVQPWLVPVRVEPDLSGLSSSGSIW